MGMEGFAARLRKAFRAYEDRVGRDITQTELGALVGAELGEDAITQQSVARWFAGTLPEHARMVALATVLGVDPGWLSYGSGGDEGEGQQPAIANGLPPRAPIETVTDPSVYVGKELPAQPKKGKRRPPGRGDRTALAS